ncbi:MAG: DUF1080 domain-containing protein [Bacteroidota bacterium]
MRSLVFIVLLVSFLGCQTSQPALEPVPTAPAAAASPAPPSEPGVRVLFDGTSLEDWTETNFGFDGSTSLEDSLLVLGMTDYMAGVTWTGAPLPTLNYEITWEAKRVDGGDFFSAITFPVGDGHMSFINGGWGGSIIGLSSIDGLDASENETRNFRRFQSDQWYAFRLQVTDTDINVWINERPVVEFEHVGRALSIRVEMDNSRPLGFASWRTRSALRNIQLRVL